MAGIQNLEVEAQAAHLAAIVESSDDAIIGKNLQSIVTSWNAGAEKTFGYTAEEMLGRSITRLIPADRQQEEVEILARVSRGESVRHFETVRRRKDGRLIDVSVTVSAIRDSSGTVVGASKVARDITERRKIDKALRERDEQLRLYAEHSPAAIAMFDQDMKYLIASRRWLEVYHLDGQTLAGRSHYEVFPEIPQRWKDIHRRCLAGAVEKCEEDSFRRAGGTTDWIRWEVRPWLQADGAIGGLIVFSEDISQRKRAEAAVLELNAQLELRVQQRTAELQAANQELEAFSYSVSHDLRAPLRAINGFADMVIEEFASQLPAECQRYLRIIKEDAVRMGELIDDLLSLSRFGRQALEPRVVDVGRLVRGALAELKPQYEGRPVDLRVGELPACLGDERLLKPVWINLLSNALKYSRQRDPAIIEIGCRREAGETVYFVRDNGAGFDMAYAGKLFGVFQRMHSSDEFEGTGVGLAIVQRIVQRHAGRVWAEAQVDQGATFYLTLNLKETGKS